MLNSSFGLYGLSLALLPTYAVAQEEVVTHKNDELTAIYRPHATNTRWENITSPADFYQSPYQMSLFFPENGEDGARLWSQTTSIFAYGFGVIGVLTLMPESITNWDQENGIFNKWGDNVTYGPVWDRDSFAVNYIGHPYFGGVYYQVARKSGYRQWDSFLYAAFMSTFYWEYGIEAFAEKPSLQDIVVTPVLGWAYGEWAFTTEMNIREQGGTVLGSQFLGDTALILLDPVDSLSRGINNLFGKEIITAGTGFVSITDAPLGSSGQSENKIQFNVTYQIGSGTSYSGKNYHAMKNNDPVDTGIIGISAGMGYVSLDDKWQLENDTVTEYSLGMYFTRSFSTKLTYASATLSNSGASTTNDSTIYENYGVSAQYYFNTEKSLRPYITAGIGETMLAEEEETKIFQMNAGVGVHYKINKNYAFQINWRHFYSGSANTDDDIVMASFIYRLGKGER